ncbi:MAG: methionyl-tRNA formyltransferase [Candidatus Moraniibacteriota bacterium]
MPHKKESAEEAVTVSVKIPQVPIVFMGTPDFSAEALKSLLEKGYHVVGVVTQTDRPVGRKQEIMPTPVKKLALENNIPVLQPETMDKEAIAALSKWKPDLIVVAAYGKILPQAILDIPGLGSVNVHASLLPKWRGASPIQNALMAGETVTGITLMLMNVGMDTGDIIAEKSIAIDPNETADQLTKRLALLGGSFLVEILPGWIKRRIIPQPQNDSDATLCQLIEREDGRVFWSAPAEEIYNRYRGLTPWPGLFTFWKKEDDHIRLKLLKISLQKTSPLIEAPLGTVFEVGEKIAVRTSTGIIFLEEIQMEGKEPVSIRDFLNGNPDFVGSLLV